MVTSECFYTIKQILGSPTTLHRNESKISLINYIKLSTGNSMQKCCRQPMHRTLINYKDVFNEKGYR